MSYLSFFTSLFLSIISLGIYLVPEVDLYWEVLMFIGRAFPVIAFAGILFGVFHIADRAKSNRGLTNTLMLSLTGVALCAMNVSTYFFIWNFN